MNNELDLNSLQTISIRNQCNRDLSLSFISSIGFCFQIDLPNLTKLDYCIHDNLDLINLVATSNGSAVF